MWQRSTVEEPLDLHVRITDRRQLTLELGDVHLDQVQLVLDLGDEPDDRRWGRGGRSVVSRGEVTSDEVRPDMVRSDVVRSDSHTGLRIVLVKSKATPGDGQDWVLDKDETW